MASSKPSSKRMPSQITELLDVAIFSFATLSGLRSTHKVRGDPVVDGVCSMFGRLLDCGNKDTKEMFQLISPARLGGWQPGCEATKELSTLVSSRLKLAKEKKIIREHAEPCPPEALVDKKQRFDEATDSVKTRVHPQCWRCKSRCRFCKSRKKKIVPSLKAEVTSPLLDVLEEMAEDIQDTDVPSDEDESVLDEIELEEGRYLIKQCLSEEDMTDKDSIAEEQESEGMELYDVEDENNEIDSSISDDNIRNDSGE